MRILFLHVMFLFLPCFLGPSVSKETKDETNKRLQNNRNNTGKTTRKFVLPRRHTHTKHQRSGSRGLPSESGSPPEHILHVTTSLDQADSSPAGHHQPARWRSRKSPSPVYKSPSPRPVSREPSPAVASPAQGSKGRSAPRGLGPSTTAPSTNHHFIGPRLSTHHLTTHPKPPPPPQHQHGGPTCPLS